MNGTAHPKQPGRSHGATFLQRPQLHSESPLGLQGGWASPLPTCSRAPGDACLWPRSIQARSLPTCPHSRTGSHLPEAGPGGRWHHHPCPRGAGASGPLLLRVTPEPTSCHAMPTLSRPCGGDRKQPGCQGTNIDCVPALWQACTSWHCYKLGQASRTKQLSCVRGQGGSCSSISGSLK